MNQEIEKTQLADEKALAGFNKMKTTIDEQIKNLQDIKVTDDTSLAVASQQLSKAKQLNKQIDEAHATVKEEALRFCQAADKAKKSFKIPLETAMAVTETEVLKYDAEVKKKKAAELAKLEKEQQGIREQQEKEATALRTEMTEFAFRAFKNINESAKAEDLALIYDQYVTKFPENYDVAIKNRIIKLGTAKIGIIKVTLTPAEYEKVYNEVTGIVPEIKVISTTGMPKFDAIESEKAVIMSSGPTNIKQEWNFEVADKTQIPLMFLEVNDSSVKAWIKEAVKNGVLKDDQECVINGFKFFQTSKVKVK